QPYRLLAFSPDGRRIATEGRRPMTEDRRPERKVLRLIDRQTGREQELPTGLLHAPQRYLLGLQFGPGGRQLGAVGDDEAALLDLGTGKEVLRKWEGPVVAGDAAFAAEGRFLVSLAHRDGEGRATAAAVWDVGAGKQVAEVSGAAGYPGDQTISADGRWLVVPRAEGEILFWDLMRNQKAPDAGPRVRLPPHTVPRLSPDHRWLLARTPGNLLPFDNGRAALWDRATGERRLEVRGSGGVYSPAFSPDGRLLALGFSEGPVHLVDVARGVEVFRWQPPAPP